MIDYCPEPAAPAVGARIIKQWEQMRVKTRALLLREPPAPTWLWFQLQQRVGTVAVQGRMCMLLVCQSL